ncbi:ABC transporter substrate-binding protein [Paenibacillus sp. MWE-103]|uniref:ABC transporter substrate-binding protein n=1 Tax=Paenibacillus artemisiicola TaxID=1172618 RepID=A0ABS3WF67_9BACL|nr:ABC transporter substrate-binding protein [Paenibacillus artemisiicola]MBO7746961.1 ABC transporter substrate-binding protein [Paenibacillus artemisiicola]
MKRMKFIAFALLLLSLTVLAACGNSNSETPANGGTNAGANAGNGSTNTQEAPAGGSIRLGLVGGGMTPMVAQVGISDGTYEKAGIKIEEKDFTAGADMVQALVGGSLDVVLGSYEHVLRQQQNGLGVKAYGEIFNGVGYSLIVKKDAPYQSLKELKGKTLAVTKVGSLSDTGLREGLKQEGLDPEKDVHLINGGSGATMLAAIESGQAAGGMVSEPTISQMLASGDYRVLYDPPFDFAGIVIMAKTDWVAKHQDLMKQFLQVTADVNEQAHQDPAGAVAAMQKIFDKIPQDVMKTAVNNQLGKVPDGLQVTKDGADYVQKTQLDQGILKKEIAFEDAVDLSLLPQ